MRNLLAMTGVGAVALTASSTAAADSAAASPAAPLTTEPYTFLLLGSALLVLGLIARRKGTQR